MLEVGQVEHLEVDRVAPASANRPRVSTACAGEPATPFATSSSTSRPIDAARRATSAPVAPTHSTSAELKVIVAGSRPTSAQAARTPSKSLAASSAEVNGVLNSAAYRAASAGVRFAPRPPTSTGMPPSCTGLGSAGESTTA